MPTPRAILSLTVRCLSSCLSASQELVGVGLRRDVELALDAGRGLGGGVGDSVTVAVTVAGEEEEYSVEVGSALDVSEALSETGRERIGSELTGKPPESVNGRE